MCMFCIATFKREKTLGSITLSQEGNDVELKIERVVAINVAHDLAHIRTTRSVPHYLDPVYEKGLPLEAYEDLDSLGDELTPMGYLGGSFVNVEPRQEISYERYTLLCLCNRILSPEWFKWGTCHQF